MGYFDKLASEGKSEEDIRKIKLELTELYNKGKTVYENILNSTNFAKEISSLRERVFDDFRDFFQSKGFEITFNKDGRQKGFKGAEAKTGETVIKLLFENQTEFVFNIPGAYSAELSLRDRNEEQVAVGAYEFEGEVKFTGKHSDEDYETMLLTKSDLQKDISAIQSKIDLKYTPELEIFNWKNEKAYDEFIALLKELNETL